MLTRLRVSGFKNLVDVDVRFGPFTCIAGPNGAGKSNLFDAIRFLSALADHPLIEAALSVRNEEGRTSDIRSLFHRVGDTYTGQMSFEAEMIVPQEAVDDLGQRARAKNTFLRYSVTVAYREDDNRPSPASLELIKEELQPINRGEASRHLLFRHNASMWRRSAVRGQPGRSVPFISTEGRGDDRIIKRHQDGRGGRTLRHAAVNLPRTVLSVASAAESPTMLVARREMQSWRLLQLEPSALRNPDRFTDSPQLGVNGAHLAATLYRLAQNSNRHKASEPSENNGSAKRVYSQVANRLAELLDDVREVWVERDDKRELLTLYVKDRYETPHPALALSDGTLRFLALAVITLDPKAQGVLCLEEPENGIDPQRIPAMLDLLEDLTTDVQESVGPDNPLRQVIINTHSPSVVAEVPEDSLLVAELKESLDSGRPFKRACFSCLPGTWRTKAEGGAGVVSMGKLLAYLNPYVSDASEQDDGAVKTRRVVDHPGLQPLLPFQESLG